MTSPLEKKLKIAGPVLITANRLNDGAVIYRTADGRWTTDFDHAAVVTTAPAATELLEAAVADDIGAVGAYVAPGKFDKDGGVRPGNLRGSLQHAGPALAFPPHPGLPGSARALAMHVLHRV